MSWAVLTLGHQASDVMVIAAGLTAVITAIVRPLFRWLEFRTFMRVWQEIVRSDRELQSVQYFPRAISAFRSRGKAADIGIPADLRNAESLLQGESPVSQ